MRTYDNDGRLIYATRSNVGESLEQRYGRHATVTPRSFEAIDLIILELWAGEDELLDLWLEE